MADTNAGNEAIPLTETVATVAPDTATNALGALTDLIAAATATTATGNGAINTDPTTTTAPTTFLTSTTNTIPSSRPPSGSSPFDGPGPPAFFTGERPPFMTDGPPPFVQPQQNLSAGAKAGIAIGAVALFAAIIALWLVFSRMKAKEDALREEGAATQTSPPSYEKSNKGNRDSVIRDFAAEAAPKSIGEKEAASSSTSLPPIESESSVISPPPAIPISSKKKKKRQSAKSGRSRRNSNLAPVSEAGEEMDSSTSQLDLVSESSTPSTPKTPRAQALKNLSGESPSKGKGPASGAPQIPSGRISPISMDFDTSPGKGRI